MKTKYSQTCVQWPSPGLYICGRCLGVGLCCKDSNRDSKMVVAIRRWSFAQGWLHFYAVKWSLGLFYIDVEMFFLGLAELSLDRNEPRQVECGFAVTKRQDIFPPRNPDLRANGTEHHLWPVRWQHRTKSKLKYRKTHDAKVKLGFNEHLGTGHLCSVFFVITGFICVIIWPIWLKNSYVITICLLRTEFVITEFHYIFWLKLSLKIFFLTVYGPIDALWDW